MLCASKMEVVVVPDSLRGFVIENIKFGKLIEKGANGTIVEGKWEGSIVAVKEMHSIFGEASELEFKSLRERFLKECERSIQLRHTNIIQFFGIFIPTGVRMPCLVMERLYCNLNNLLQTHQDIPPEIKLNLVHGVSLGLRYLHSRAPPILHHDLTSRNILVSKEMKAKIADLSTVRFANQMSLAPGTQDFMPPEVLLNNGPNRRYGTNADVFSFGCVMLHTFSHQWPTPQNIISDSPSNTHTELKRRSHYIKTIPSTVQDLILPIITACLENEPSDRPDVVNICDQLESLVNNRELTLPESMLHAHLKLQEAKQEVKDYTVKLCSKGVELHNKSAEVEKLKSEISQLNLSSSTTRQQQVSKSAAKFWSSIELKWQYVNDLPAKCWVTSVVELDGNVYATIDGPSCSYNDPIMYDSRANKWVILPSLPCNQYSLAVVPNKKHLLAIGGRTVNIEFTGLSNRAFLWDEVYRKWLNPYPDMPTARLDCSSIGYQSSVIVAGGVTCLQPWTISRIVEVLQVNDNRISDSIWSRVEPLPHIVHEAVPLIVGEKIFFAVGYDEHRGSTSTIVAANLPALLYEPTAFQAWEKIPDMPYSCPCITYYGDRLITFGGDGLVERPDEDTPVWEFFPPINIYNPDTKSWDHVGDISHGYYLGKSVHLSDNQILFIGGLVGKLSVSEESLLTTCSLLTIADKTDTGD